MKVSWPVFVYCAICLWVNASSSPKIQDTFQPQNFYINDISELITGLQVDHSPYYDFFQIKKDSEALAEKTTLDNEDDKKDSGPHQCDWLSLASLGRSSALTEEGHGSSTPEQLSSHTDTPGADYTMRDAMHVDHFSVLSRTDNPSETYEEVSSSAKGTGRRLLSPYANFLTQKGISLKHLNKIYKEAAKIDSQDAYRRIRAKLTPTLERKLTSSDSIKIQQVVKELGRIDPNSKLDYKEMRLLKAKMAPYLAEKKLKGRNVTSSGMRRFPEQHIWQLLSGEGQIFTQAADQLYKCYLAEDNEKRKARLKRLRLEKSAQVQRQY